MALFAHSLSPVTHFSRQLSVTPSKVNTLPHLFSSPSRFQPPPPLRNVRAKCVYLNSLRPPPYLPTLHLAHDLLGRIGRVACERTRWKKKKENAPCVSTHGGQHFSASSPERPCPRRIPYKDRGRKEGEEKRGQVLFPRFSFQLCFLIASFRKKAHIWSGE